MDGFMHIPAYAYAAPSRAGPSRPTPPQLQHQHSMPLPMHPQTSPSGPVSRSVSVSASSSSANAPRRPKIPKKGHSSNVTKQRTVQQSLEAKVEKCRGWNALFVPLARGVPSAPPSSPVLAPAERDTRGQAHAQGHQASGNGYGFEVEHCEHAGGAQGGNSMGQRQGYSNGQSHAAHGQDHRHDRATLPGSPGSPCARSDSTNDLSRESTRTLVDHELQPQPHPHGQNGDYFGKWANQQWVEDVRLDSLPLHLSNAMAMPAFQLGPGALGFAGGEQERRDGDMEMDG